MPRRRNRGPPTEAEWARIAHYSALYMETVRREMEDAEGAWMWAEEDWDWVETGRWPQDNYYQDDGRDECGGTGATREEKKCAICCSTGESPDGDVADEESDDDD
ncbi:unnamed protein product [Amoebophrya sp. A120]|nr:unnamed protein product [Amoebophrya sp. A120]|eukprot:GSA120T00001421001.1